MSVSVDYKRFTARYRPLWPMLHWLGAGVLIIAWVIIPGDGFDARNYHAIDYADPYHAAWYAPGSFVYSPAFAQLLWPFTLLPFEVFAKLLLAVNLLCLGWLLTPAWAGLSLVLLPVTSELMVGNIHLPLAVLCVVGLRYSATWAFGILTKITPGVGILWFAARGEWRGLWIAIATTVLVVAVSVVTWPSAWLDWFDVLLGGAGRDAPWYTLNETSVLVRLPIAAVLAIAAARRDRPAAIPVIVLFSLPAVWFSALVMLAAVPRLIRISADAARDGGSA